LDVTRVAQIEAQESATDEIHAVKEIKSMMTGVMANGQSHPRAAQALAIVGIEFGMKFGEKSACRRLAVTPPARGGSEPPSWPEDESRWAVTRGICKLVIS